MSTPQKTFLPKKIPGNQKSDWKENLFILLFFIFLVSLSLLTEN